MRSKSFLAGLLLLLSASTAWSSGFLRVTHLSPDAPDVDVYVDGALLLQDVPYLTTSAYLALDAGDYQIQVTPAGAPTPIVIDAVVSVANGESKTVAATGLLQAGDLSPLVLIDDRVTDPDNAKVRFVHASPDAPAVDVALANGGAVLFPNAMFRDSTAYLELAPGTYDLEVRLQGTNTVVLSLPGVTLSAAINIEVFATGLVGDQTLGALPVVTAVPGVARLRIAHLSPDAPNVDVRADGALLAENVPFGTISEYLEVAPGTYQVQVTPTGAAAPIVVDESLTFHGGEAYTVAATGLLLQGDLLALQLVDSLDTDPTQARVRFTHGSPDAPPVDIAVSGGQVLFPNFSFRDTSAYLDVAAGTYDLEVRLAGTNTVVLPLPGIVLIPGINASVFAAGLVGDSTLNAIIAVDVNDNFIRGDANNDGSIGLVDAIETLLKVFTDTEVEICDDAADVDDNGHLTLVDPIALLNYLFLAGAEPAAPFPASGTDTSTDTLKCQFSD